MSRRYRYKKKQDGDINWEAAAKRAEKKFAENKAAVESGETFRGTKTSTYRRNTKRGISDGPHS